jgi:hypothetical protein
MALQFVFRSTHAIAAVIGRSRLVRDEGGAISALGMLLLTTIVALGAIVGLATFRDQVVQELGDVALALQNLNQSFSTASMGTFVDLGPFPTDPPNAPPACLNLCGP